MLDLAKARYTCDACGEVGGGGGRRKTWKRDLAREKHQRVLDWIKRAIDCLEVDYD
jgi:hypothetical protein